MIKKTATYAFAAIAISGIGTSDESLAKVSDYISSATETLSVNQRNSRNVTSRYVRKGHDNCFIVNTIGPSTMSVSVPCNK